jgi:hypothetical protein
MQSSTDTIDPLHKGLYAQLSATQKAKALLMSYGADINKLYGEDPHPDPHPHNHNRVGGISVNCNMGEGRARLQFLYLPPDGSEGRRRIAPLLKKLGVEPNPDPTYHEESLSKIYKGNPYAGMGGELHEMLDRLMEERAKELSKAKGFQARGRAAGQER